MDIYEKQEGKSSGSALELQEKFREKAIPSHAKIGKKIVKLEKKKLSKCQKFLKLEI